MKKTAIKTAVISAFIAAGLAACTSTPDAQQGAAPAATSTPSSTSTPTSQPSTPPSVVTEVVTATVTNPPQPVRNTDNRPGFGALKLGMSIAEAKSAGLIPQSFGLGDSDCWANDQVAVSSKYGVERITLPAGTKTSAGIGVGATFAQVKKAYPTATEYRSGWSVQLGDYGYGFIATRSAERYADTDKVGEIKLYAKNTDCAFAIL